MLGEHPIDVVLLATDLESSKEFYAGTTGTADEQTQAGWRVTDLAAELR